MKEVNDLANEILVETRPELTCPNCRRKDVNYLLMQTPKMRILGMYHVKATCNHCGKFIKFVPATPAMIASADRPKNQLFE